MPSRSWASRSLTALLLFALAGGATWLVHRETLSYGFDYDDYYFMRPHTPAQVLATFSGPWDPGGVMVKFYRPLTIVLHAIRFELFGLNAVAHHAMSLASFALAAGLVAWLVYGWTGRAAAGAIAAVLVVSHPAMPYSLVAWITNQMHLAQTLIVLTALVWWHAVRARSLVWWLPLLLFGVASFMVKEDGVMLLPAILTVHAITRRVAEPGLRPAPWAFAALSGGLIVALLVWRSTALGELGGYGRPTMHAAWVNYSRGLTRVFGLVPADRPWQPLASWFATLLPIVAIAAWRWISAGARVCLLAGVAIAVLFNVPFVFVTKAEQMYLVGIGAALMLAGASVALLDLAARTQARLAATLIVAVVLGAGLASFVAVTRDITRDFEPFGPIVLSHDDIVRTWGPGATRAARVCGTQARAECRQARLVQSARRAVAGHLRGARPGDQPPRRGLHVDVRVAGRNSRGRERAHRHDPAAAPDRVVSRAHARPHRRRRPARRRPPTGHA